MRWCATCPPGPGVRRDASEATPVNFEASKRAIASRLSPPVPSSTFPCAAVECLLFLARRLPRHDIRLFQRTEKKIGPPASLPPFRSCGNRFGALLSLSPSRRRSHQRSRGEEDPSAIFPSISECGDSRHCRPYHFGASIGLYIATPVSTNARFLTREMREYRVRRAQVQRIILLASP